MTILPGLQHSGFALTRINKDPAGARPNLTHTRSIPKWHESFAPHLAISNGAGALAKYKFVPVREKGLAQAERCRASAMSHEVIRSSPKSKTVASDSAQGHG